MTYHSIYLYFAAGGIAFATVITAYILSKSYPLPYLTYYFYYLLIFNFGNFAARPLRILMVEILNLNAVQTQTFYAVQFFFVVGPLFIVGLYLLIKFALALVEKKMSPTFKVVYFSYWGLRYISGLILVLNFFKTKDHSLLHTVGFFGDLVFIIFLLSLQAYIIFNAKHLKNPDWKKGVRTFAIIYFVSLAFFNLSPYFLTGTLVFMLSFLYVLPPLLYLGGFLKKYFREHPPLPEESRGIEGIFKRYNISQREQEVIQLICKGKSNREIADILFLSLQTVKHHVYNIYRKLNIKNRVQLTNFLQNAARNH